MTTKTTTTAIEYNSTRGYSRETWQHIQIAVRANPDGVPGAETAERVYEWQAANGIEADGKVGPKTLETIGAKPNASGHLFFPSLVANNPERVFGIDVSDYQGKPNFRHVFNAGARFVVIKLSEGRTWRSRYAAENWPKAVDAGLVVSGYHLARLVDAGHESNVEGAVDNLFGMLERVNATEPRRSRFSLPHFLDLELKQLKEHSNRFGTSATLAWIERFVALYRERDGVDCGLYLSRWGAKLLGHNCGRLPELVTWWADYSSAIATPPDRGLDYWQEWKLRQFTSGAMVPGVSGPCDADFARR